MTHKQANELYQLAPGCPWADWERPNVRWCEDYICDWVVTPANTWSNLAYFASAYAVHVSLKGNMNRLVWLFVPATILTGLTSLVYHASVSRFFQLFDFFGMFTFCMLGVVLNLRRELILDHARIKLAYVVGLSLCALAIPVFEFGLSLPIQSTVLALIILQLGQEIRLRMGRYRKHPQLCPPYRRFTESLILLTCAFICSVADVTRLWCDPTNHFVQGHAIWHVLSAMSLYFLFLFYKQIDFDNIGEGTLLGI